MWTIKNNIIPFKGFKAITIWPFVFVRKDSKYTTVDARHECIHVADSILDWYGESWHGEPSAYLVGFMTKEIVELIGEPCF